MFRSTITPVLVASIATLAGISIAGCQTDRTRRTDPNADINLVRRFNDADMKLIAKSMTTDALSRPWLEQAIAKLGRKPIIAVGEIRNGTDQVVATQFMTTKFEEELINSGRVDVIAERNIRETLRLERSDTEFTDPAFIKKMKAEMAVDFILSGNIVMDREMSKSGGSDFVAYQVDMQLLDIETLRKVWLKTENVKKERY